MMRIVFKCFLFISILSTSLVFAETENVAGPTKTPEDDQAKIEEYNQACQVISTLLVKKEFNVDCFSNYQHYGPTSKSLKSSGTLRIAGYNLLHPGTSKALFKDYSLIAKIMNKYDVVSGLEILGTVGHDEANNQAVLAFIQSSPAMIADLNSQKTKTTDLAKIKVINDKLAKLISDTRAAYSLYRAPGYYKILMALKKLDPSWALILSPRGDSALQGSVEEMVGFFYRANNVTPVSNPHCSEFRDENGGTPYACILNLSQKFMEKDYTHNFARRPFMVSFKAGSMKFSLISMHVVFNFSGDDDAQKKLMNDVFGVNAPSDIGGGLNSSNFARFAEVKTTLNFMNRFRKKYNDNNIMFVSDTNLVANNPYWNEVLKSFPGGSLLINDATTLSPPRYTSDGKETLGVANSYDHFVLDKSVFPGCDDGHVFNYYKSDIESDIEKMYMVRSANSLYLQNKSFDGFNDGDVLVGGDIPPEETPLPAKFDYPLSNIGQMKINQMVNTYSSQLTSLLTVKKNQVVADDFLVQDRIDGFKRRVFLNQLTNAFYYRFYQEILSDHFPVSINCKI
ncbi:MAG: hypothetical protein Q7U04_14175 [Bacteriovorax sp.]|nr:hypothetical protein [Bacteriovorax sp.]